MDDDGGVTLDTITITRVINPDGRLTTDIRISDGLSYYDAMAMCAIAQASMGELYVDDEADL